MHSATSFDAQDWSELWSRVQKRGGHGDALSTTRVRSRCKCLTIEWLA